MNTFVLGLCRAAAVALCVSASGFSWTASAAEIVWQDKKFHRESDDEEVELVLRQILNENGLQADFRSGIKGSVTFRFDNMPLQDAFNKLISDLNLEYSFNPDNRIVTITSPLPGRLFTLQMAKPDQLQAAKKKLKIGGDLAVEPDSGIVMARGTPQQVLQLEDLAKRLDQTELEKRNVMRSELARDTELGTKDAARRAADADARFRELQAEIHARLHDDIVNTRTKVVAIKYATVGPSTQTFQGQSITLPGIDETLRSLLGLGETKPGPAGAPGVGTPLEQQELARIRREMGQVPPVISIDPRSNSVIVRGSPNAIREVENLIAQLDRPLLLVEIEVMIVRASRGVAEELGVRWGGGTTRLSGNGATLGSSVNTGIASTNLVPTLDSTQQQVPTSTVTNSGTTTVSSTSGYTKVPIQPLDPFTLLPTSASGTVAAFLFRGNNFTLQAQINALSDASKLQTIAAPRVVTLNNMQAKVTNDRTQYLAIPAAANAPGGFHELKAGLTATITPSLIQRDDTGEQPLVRLKINAQDKSVQTSPEGRPTLAGNEVQTEVVIPDGSTFVMGGLLSDLRTEISSKVPGLGDIPLLGELFKSRGSRSDLDETIFFITPRLVQTSDVYAQDIAQRRYLQSQRAKLAELRQDIQGGSQLLDVNPILMEEDE